jgi:hypothetical protein
VVEHTLGKGGLTNPQQLSVIKSQDISCLWIILITSETQARTHTKRLMIMVVVDMNSYRKRDAEQDEMLADVKLYDIPRHELIEIVRDASGTHTEINAGKMFMIITGRTNIMEQELEVLNYAITCVVAERSLKH